MQRTGTLRWIIAPVLVLVGIGIGWVLRGQAESLSRDEPAHAPVRAADEQRTDPVLAGRAETSFPVGRPLAGPERAGPIAEGVPAREGATPAGGRIEVTLDVPDGWPKLRGYVYALPAGADGVARVELAPHARVWNSKCEPIRVPTAGSWDVFLVAGWTAGSALDVEVAPDATSPLRLAPYPSAPIRFDLDGDLPSRREGVWVGMQALAAGTGSNVEFPGRRGRPAIGLLAFFDEQGTATSRPLPTRYAYEVSPEFMRMIEGGGSPRIDARVTHPGSWRLVPERARASAGDTVSVHVQRRSGLRVRIHTDRAFPDSWGAWTPTVYLELHAEGGAGDKAWIRIPAGGRAPATRAVLWGDPGMARLTWGGNGLVSGAKGDIRLEVGGDRAADILLELEPAFSPADASRSRSEDFVRVEVEGWTDATGDAELVIFGPRPAGKAAQRIDDLQLDYPRRSTFHRESFTPRKFWAVRCPDLASDVAEIGGDGVLRLAMQPAGYLLVAPDWILPSGSGALLLERADGTPFPVCVVEDDDAPPGIHDMGRRVQVRAGWLVGPLPAGTRRFRVRLGGVPLPDVVGRVVAGRVEVLRIAR